MLKNRKSLLLLIILTISTSLLAQERTYSPYSRFGIGDIEGSGIGRAQGMGGTGVAQRSSYSLNDLNPAAITAIDSFSFIFEGGASYFSQNINTANSSITKSNVIFDYLAMGFPISKRVFTSFGFKPYSCVGYNAAGTKYSSPDRVLNTTTGSGTITKAFLNIGGLAVKNFSVGINVGYLFGTQKHITYTEFLDEPNALKSGSSRIVKVNDLTLDFGAQYTYNFNSSKRLILGAAVTPEADLDGQVDLMVQSGYYYTTSPDDENLFADENVATLNDTTVNLSTIGSKLPLRIGLGATYEVANKLSTSIDYTMGNWSQTPFYENITETTNSHYINAGAEYIPNDISHDNLFARIRYRAGFFYKKDYIVLNDYQLTDYGITFGAGIPMKRSKNSVNFSIKYGTRGTTDFGLVKENYFRISVDVIMHEYWFVKRRIN